MSSAQRPSRSLAHYSALVFSDDAVVAALMLSLLEVQGLAPRYPRRSETPAAAVMRLRPRVVLLDSHHAAAASDAFYTAASEAGAAVIVFGPVHARSKIEAMADVHGIRWLTLPIDGARLHRALVAALRTTASSSDD